MIKIYPTFIVLLFSACILAQEKGSELALAKRVRISEEPAQESSSSEKSEMPEVSDEGDSEEPDIDLSDAENESHEESEENVEIVQKESAAPKLSMIQDILLNNKKIDNKVPKLFGLNEDESTPSSEAAIELTKGAWIIELIDELADKDDNERDNELFNDFNTLTFEWWSQRSKDREELTALLQRKDKHALCEIIKIFDNTTQMVTGSLFERQRFYKSRIKAAANDYFVVRDM